MTQWLRFVRHAEVEQFAVRGWRIVATDLGHHSAHAVLMQWEGSGEPD